MNDDICIFEILILQSEDITGCTDENTLNNWLQLKFILVPPRITLS